MRRIVVIFSLLVAAVIVGSAGTGPTVAALPTGFTDELVVDLAATATTVEALPDGRVIVLEQDGAIVRIDARDRNATPTVTTMATLAVCSNSERGLLGFAVDPDFTTSGFVYVYYTVPSDAPGGCHNRVSRFTMDDDTLFLESETVLVDRISSVAGNHNGGDVEIGDDGHLYIAVGDGGRDPRGDSGSAGANDAAQDLSLLNGKILRVRRASGAAVDGNPFTAEGSGGVDCRVRGNTPETPTTPCREIFASGLRNPYRFAFDPNTSATRFFINDVGQNSREEVNEGRLNANYGWPVREGACPQGENPPCDGPSPAYTDPILDYGHDRGLYVTGGAFVPNGTWPRQYDGGYLFADGAFGDIWLRRADGTVDFDDPFLETARPTDLVFVQDAAGAALWYVQQDGEVHRVTTELPPADEETAPLRYAPLDTPDRAYDSRELSPPAPLRGGRSRMIDVEAPDGAVAAMVNVTLVRPATDGAFTTAWEPGTARPTTSNVNAPALSNVGNASIVPLDEQGRLMLYVSVTTDVVIDVAGFFVPAPDAVGAGRFEALAPDRLIDTRNPSAAGNEYLDMGVAEVGPEGRVVRVPVLGEAGLPEDADEVVAVAVVIAALSGPVDRAGFATIFTPGEPFPLASNVNVNGSYDVRANLAVVPVSADGAIDVRLVDVDFITIDVAGYFTGTGSAEDSAGRFHLTAPTREYDSRLGDEPPGLGSTGTRTFDPSVPDTASAIAQNITLATSGGRGFVTAYPTDPRPTVSSINASGPGQTRGALGLVALADDGTERVFAELDNGVVIDSFGWFE